MAQVIRPQKTDDTNQIFQLGGAAIGGAYGGVGGAAAGAGIGGTLGSVVNPPQPQQPGLDSGSESAAMARRQQQMSQDTLGTLKQAEAALPQLPEALRQQYAPAIVQARMMAQQQG